jgi:CubicO group peptidase (beta-lactamase class C family)
MHRNCFLKPICCKLCPFREQKIITIFEPSYIIIKKIKKLLTAVFLLTSLFGSSQTLQDTLLKIDALFSRIQPAIPGCQVTIARNGINIFSKAWGSADLEHNVPLTTKSIIEAGSVSKQFTAAAILLLEQQGKLSLTDKLLKHIPELPAINAGITLEQMIHHTSGLRDWGSVAILTGWPRSSKAYSNDDALDIMMHQDALNHTPGYEYLYSNSNYNLLALIVERVSGLSLAAFTNKHIFVPAGMTNTSWRDDYKRIVPNRAIAYSKLDSGYETNMPNEYVYGNGGLLTTTEDLVKWNNYYLSGKLGSPALSGKQTGIQPLLSGANTTYAAGLMMVKQNGEAAIAHDGATAGYRCFLIHFPSYNLDIALLANSTEFDNWNPYPITSLINLFVKKVPPVTEPGIENFQGDATAFAGWYRNIRTGNGVELQVRDKKGYWDGRLELIPVSANKFRQGPNSFVFNNDKLTVITSSNDSLHLIRVKKNQLRLSDYTGEYFSNEAQANGTIVNRHDTLYLVVKKDYEFEMTPTFEDGFKLPQLGNLYFERNHKNEIVKMKVSSSRARNVEYVRIKKK